jgi:hypothetical protein
MEDESGHSITKEFLETTLKSKVKSFTVQPGSNHGDNYTSILHSIEVHLEDNAAAEPLQLLLKVYPNHPARKKFLDDTNLFLKELLVYQKLVPEIQGLVCKEANGNIGNELKLSLPPLVAGKAVDYTTIEESKAAYSLAIGLKFILCSYILLKLFTSIHTSLMSFLHQKA